MEPVNLLSRVADIGAFGLVFLFIWIFLTRYFWPWFTNSYWPSRQIADTQRTELLRSINDAIIAMKTISLEEMVERRLLGGSITEIAKTQEGIVELERAMNSTQQRILDRIDSTDRLLSIITEFYIKLNNSTTGRIIAEQLGRQDGGKNEKTGEHPVVPAATG